jgi:hypothetical protein
MINFGGRFLYLETIEKEWPELLYALCTRCLPVFRTLVLASGQPEPGGFRELRSLPCCQTSADQVQAWADEYNVHDEWILDAAVQTLTYLAKAGSPKPRWVYIVLDLPLRLFDARFQAAWIPGLMEWTTFKNELERQLSERLEVYGKEVGPTWGEEKRSSHLHALWTLWWQQGKSPAQIRLKSAARGLTGASHASIQKGVQSFADSIALTLRKSGSRRTAPV